MAKDKKDNKKKPTPKSTHKSVPNKAVKKTPKEETEPTTIDMPRSEGDGVIRIKEPQDRPVHWTDVMKAEWDEDNKDYRCLACGKTCTRRSPKELPAGDELCSHEWEECPCQDPGSTSEVVTSLTTPLDSQESASPASTASPTSSSLTTAATPTTSVATTKIQTSILDKLKTGQTKSGFAQRVNQIQTERQQSNSQVGPQHLMIIARAGTGKTTTLVEALKLLKGIKPYITPSEEQQAIWDCVGQSTFHRFCCFAAFNNGIAKELRERVPQGVDAKTMHGIGYQAVRKAFQLPDDAVERGSERIPNIISEIMGMDIREIRKMIPTLASVTESLVELCKANLVGVGDEFSNEEWPQEIANLIYQYDIDVDGTFTFKGEPVNIMDLVVELVPAVLERCKNVNKDRCITFTDMIWLPVVLKLPMFKFEILFVDEAQDLNKCQHELLKRIGKRIIMCGDPAQSIYGFAGADSDSIPRITQWLKEQPQGLTELKLTVTRRCGKAIVKEANQEVPDFYAHPDNPEGVVKTLKYPLQSRKAPSGERQTYEIPVEQTYLPEVQVGDMVLCRSIAPLVSQYFKLMKMGKPATIQGKDIAQQIINLITKMKVSTVVELIAKLDDWLHDELEKEQAKRNPRESFMQSLKDKYDCAKFFCEDMKLVTEVIRKIEEVFTKDSTDTRKVRLMSIHKSKGLESKRVFYLRPAVYPTRREDKMLPWQVQEERNLRYVAKTRAIEELYYVV